VYTQGNVGVGTAVPALPLHVASGASMVQSGSGFISGGKMLVGPGDGVRIDDHIIQQVQAAFGTGGPLRLNPYGGNVDLGGPSSAVNVLGTIFSVENTAFFRDVVRVDEYISIQSGISEVARLDQTAGDGYLELRDQSNTPSIILNSDSVQNAGELAMYAAEGGVKAVQVLSDESDAAPRLRFNTATAANTVELDGLETSSTLSGGALRLNNSSGALTIHLQGGPGHINCVSLTQTSTRAAKRHIRPLTGALELVRRLQGVRFEWNEQYGGQADIGFIAEDVNGVVPEVVTMQDDGVNVLGLDYGHLTAVAIEAIKAVDEETRARLEAKDAEVAALRHEVALLRALIHERLNTKGQ